VSFMPSTCKISPSQPWISSPSGARSSFTTV
jgi:hypothetical protein